MVRGSQGLERLDEVTDEEELPGRDINWYTGTDHT